MNKIVLLKLFIYIPLAVLLIDDSSDACDLKSIEDLKKDEVAQSLSQKTKHFERVDSLKLSQQNNGQIPTEKSTLKIFDLDPSSPYPEIFIPGHT